MMSSLLVVNIAQAVSGTAIPSHGRKMRELTTHAPAAIYAREGLIEAVGPREQVEREISGDPVILDAGGGAVIPGFVDSHTHLVFGGRREDEFDQKIAGASYQEIAAAGGGTTTMEIKSGYGLDLENELKILEVIAELGRRQPVEVVPTFMGAHAVPPGVSAQEQTQRVIAMLPHVQGKAEYCDVFCERGYFGIDETRAILAAAKRAGLKLRLHADQLSSNGGVQLALNMGARSVDHLEQISPGEIVQLADSSCAATLLPGVSLFLHYGYPPARRLIDEGAIVTLASNFNPGSCMCLNLQLVFALACMQMRMTTAEALIALTANAAWALDRPHIGRLEPGLQADFLLLDSPSYRVIPYFFGENHVKVVVKKGEVVVG